MIKIIPATGGEIAIACTYDAFGLSTVSLSDEPVIGWRRTIPASTLRCRVILDSLQWLFVMVTDLKPTTRLATPSASGGAWWPERRTVWPPVRLTHLAGG